MKYTHPGIYHNFKKKKTNEKGELEEVDHWAWSCCQNEVKDSPGCNQVVVDKGKWNLASYVYNSGPADLDEL